MTPQESINLCNHILELRLDTGSLNDKIRKLDLAFFGIPKDILEHDVIQLSTELSELVYNISSFQTKVQNHFTPKPK